MSQNCFDLGYIFKEIEEERNLQEVLHPWENLDIRVLGTDREYHRKRAEDLKRSNDFLERSGILFIDMLVQEEIHETFEERDSVKQEAEAIQAASLLIRYIQYSRAKRARRG